MLACQTPSVRCVNKTRLTLEMRSHDQLVRAHPDPRVHLRAVDQDDSVIVRLILHAEPDGEIEIVSFGLVPDRQGHGFGGPALTLAVDLAWTAFGGEVSRVWLHTNNFDHSSALPNYLKRGFTIIEEVVLRVSVPDNWGPSSSR